MTPIRRLLAGYDFSPNADAALDLALAIAAKFNAEVVVANVINRRDIDAIEYAVNRSLLVVEKTFPDQLVHDYETERYTALKEQISSRSVKELSVIPVIRIGHPVEELLRLIDQKQVDLVVMGTRGKRTIEKFVFGSTAEKMFRLCPVPILTVPAASPRKPAAHAGREASDGDGK